MIRPLRSAHRAIWSALALLLPLAFAAALAARPDLPIEDVAALDPGASLALAADAPDTLVYWSAEPASDGAFPEAARYLGRVDRALPPVEPGYLVLFSLAHRRVIASLPVARENP